MCHLNTDKTHEVSFKQTDLGNKIMVLQIWGSLQRTTDYYTYIYIFFSSLVVSDVAFYTGSIKSLAGLENLDDNMDDIWDKT